MRKLVSSGSPFEPTIGFSRAVRTEAHVFVSGTAAIGADGKTVGIGDAAAQARRVLEIIKGALEDAGASLSDVVRTRIFLAHMEEWETVARVHGEVFSDIRPATTFVEVNRFINPDWRVEIEADAVIAGGKERSA
jgi:enamine deaminase RidA (YjgF/YER057c/UK114 family)